jgi:hypothetical protein
MSPRSADSRRISTVETRLSASTSTFTDPETRVGVALPLRMLIDAFFRALLPGPVRRATLGMGADVERHMARVVVDNGAPDVERCVAEALGARVLGGTRPLRVVPPSDEVAEDFVSEAGLIARVQSDEWLIAHDMKGES